MEEPDGDQDANPATSEGLFIDDNTFGVDVAVGDYVRVTGTVTEFQNQTQLSSITSVVLCENDPVSATPISITLPFSATTFPERVEGMSVVMTQTLTVNETFNLGRGGILTLSNGRLQQPTNVVLPGAPAGALQADNNRNQITLDDSNLTQNPDPIVYPPPGLDRAQHRAQRRLSEQHRRRVDTGEPWLDHPRKHLPHQPVQHADLHGNESPTAGPEPGAG